MFLIVIIDRRNSRKSLAYETSDWSDTASTSSHDVQRPKSDNKKQRENHIFHENRSHSNKVNKAFLISAIKFFPILMVIGVLMYIKFETFSFNFIFLLMK